MGSTVRASHGTSGLVCFLLGTVAPLALISWLLLAH
jgi:hypothetical protein